MTSQREYTQSMEALGDSVTNWALILQLLVTIFWFKRYSTSRTSLTLTAGVSSLVGVGGILLLVIMTILPEIRCDPSLVYVQVFVTVGSVMGRQVYLVSKARSAWTFDPALTSPTSSSSTTCSSRTTITLLKSGLPLLFIFTIIAHFGVQVWAIHSLSNEFHKASNCALRVPTSDPITITVSTSALWTTHVFGTLIFLYPTHRAYCVLQQSRQDSVLMNNLQHEGRGKASSQGRVKASSQPGGNHQHSSPQPSPKPSPTPSAQLFASPRVSSHHSSSSSKPLSAIVQRRLFPDYLTKLRRSVLTMTLAFGISIILWTPMLLYGNFAPQSSLPTLDFALSWLLALVTPKFPVEYSMKYHRQRHRSSESRSASPASSSRYSPRHQPQPQPSHHHRPQNPSPIPSPSQSPSYRPRHTFRTSTASSSPSLGSRTARVQPMGTPATNPDPASTMLLRVPDHTDFHGNPLYTHAASPVLEEQHDMIGASSSHTLARRTPTLHQQQQPPPQQHSGTPPFTAQPVVPMITSAFTDEVV